MWEYSITIQNCNQKVLDYLFNASKKYMNNFGGVVFINKGDEETSLLFAIQNEKIEGIKAFLKKIITQAICKFFKIEYLNENLYVTSKDKIVELAFKKALVNFDKETDYYIISKNLDFEKNLFLESFYNFKLQKLRNKWTELIDLANENKEQLMNNSSFIDLIRFLIENIDFSEDEIDIIEDDDGYRIFSGKEEDSIVGLSCENLISSLIDLSPHKINIYCQKENEATDLIKKIYDKRVHFMFSSKEENCCLTFSKN